MKKQTEKQTNNQTDIEPFDPTKIAESLVVKGDISGLTPDEKTRYYLQMCTSLGLNPASHPLAFLKFQGKEILYASRGATDQLAAIHKLNREILDGPKVIDLEGTKVVYALARATHPDGRSETATATLPFVDPVNVLMKCETKAKRRATLSILGLGILDESELETLPLPPLPVSSTTFTKIAVEPLAPEQCPLPPMPELQERNVVDELASKFLEGCGETQPTPLIAGRFFVDSKKALDSEESAELAKRLFKTLPNGTTQAKFQNAILFNEIEDDLALCKCLEDFQSCWALWSGKVLPLAKGIRATIELKFRTSAQNADIKEENLDWIFRSKDPNDFALEELTEKITPKTDPWDVAGSWTKRSGSLGKHKVLGRTRVLKKLAELGLTEFEAISTLETAERRAALPTLETAERRAALPE